jgi:hypothetical protein
MIRTCVLGLAFVLVPAACGDGDPGTHTRFTSDQYPFSVSYPTEWRVERDTFGTIVIFLSPLLDTDDTFAENVNVVVEDLRGEELSLTEYMALTMDVLEDVIVDFHVLAEGPDTLGDEPAHFIEYTGTEPSVGVSLTWRQTITIHGAHAYVITYTGERDYSEFRDAALLIFDSWEWR